MVTEMAGFKQYVSSTQKHRPVVYILLMGQTNFRRTPELLYNSSFITLLKRHAIGFNKFPNMRTINCQDHTTIPLTYLYSFLGPTWCVDRHTPVRWMWIVLMCWPVLEPQSTRYLAFLTYISIALYFIYTHIISQFMCRNKEKICFQNIRTINKLLHFNVSHRFQLWSCFVDLYRYKAVS